MITFFKNQNIRFQFENGFILSLAAGPGTYSSNKKMAYSGVSSELNEVEVIEIACWHKDTTHDWVRLSASDDVRGYCTADEVAKIITIVSSATTAEEITAAVLAK